MSELGGVRVLLTRASEDNARLAAALRSRGADVLELPCVRVEPADAEALAAAIRALGRDDVLVLTSRAGVGAVLGAAGGAPLRASVACIGASTGRRLAEAGLSAAFVASGSKGTSLARELPLPRGRVLLARSDRALSGLADALRARGARVEEIVAYRTVPGASGDVQGARRRLRAGEIDVVVFASPSAVEGLCEAIPPDDVRRARIVAIGPTTAGRVRERMGVDARVAPEASLDGLLRAIESWAGEAGHVAHV